MHDTRSPNSQPPVLISRLMLNLRQLNQTEGSHANSDAQHFSRFSVPNFRIVTTDFLGNMGEPMDTSPTEPSGDDSDDLNHSPIDVGRRESEPA